MAHCTALDQTEAGHAQVLLCITDGRADDPDTLLDVWVLSVQQLQLGLELMQDARRRVVEMAGRLDDIRAPPFQLGIQCVRSA